jgi:hypothetical protein
MITKTFEIRDSATFMPVLGIQLSSNNEADQYLLARAGFGVTSEAQATYIICLKLTGYEQSYDPYYWGNRTMRVAHQYIKDNFSKLESGSVIDVQYILGETKEAKKSERITVGY